MSQYPAVFCKFTWSINYCPFGPKPKEVLVEPVLKKCVVSFTEKFPTILYANIVVLSWSYLVHKLLLVAGIS